MPQLFASVRPERPERGTGTDLSRGTRGRSRAACTSRRRSNRRRASVAGEIAVDLPGRDVPDVVEPLLALRLDEVIEDVFAQRLPHEVVLLELVECLGQVPRQLVDAQVAPLA